jgi:acetylornithine deacetylase
MTTAPTAEVGSNTDDLLELVERLVETPTVTGNERPGQEVVIEYLESMGLEPDVWVPEESALTDHAGYARTSVTAEVGFEGRPNVAVRVPGSGDGPTLTVGGHIDVVDVTEDEWTRDPWELTREGETLYGRGVADMKGGLAAVLYTVKTVLNSEVDLAGDLIVQSTIEEEAGGTGGALATIERGYLPDAAAIAEPSDIPNITVASAGVMYFEVTVPGVSAHAAWGHEGDNAIGNATLVYQALEDLDRERKDRIDFEPAYRANPGLEGNVTNINIGQIEAGDWPSTLPSRATMRGRVGWPPGESRETVRAQIEAAVAGVTDHEDWAVDAAPTVDWVGWQAAPHWTDSDSAVARLAMETAEAVTGETGAFTGGNGGMDERFYKRYYDVPSVSVGPTPHNIHGADEHTSVASLVETSRTYARVITEYCGVTD